MNARTKMFRSLMLAGILAGVVAVQSPARACTNDIDCPGTGCGTDLCDWDQAMTCKPAGKNAAGVINKGWCTADSDCKCKDQGAKCVGFYCSFTTPKTGTAGTSGGAGTTGAAGATGAAGTAASAGTSGGTAGTKGTDGGTTPMPSSGGGCSVAASSPSGLVALAGLALVVGGVVRRRRRA